MAKRVELTCDVCGTADEVRSGYRVRTPDDSADLDLCPRHAAPLVALAKRGGRKRRRAEPARHKVEPFHWRP
jgi:hypothetical protein